VKKNSSIQRTVCGVLTLGILPFKEAESDMFQRHINYTLCEFGANCEDFFLYKSTMNFKERYSMVNSIEMGFP
jgi:hypothetical protein